MGATTRRLAVAVAGRAVARWSPRSRLFVVGDGIGWSIDHDVRELTRLARRTGVRVADRRLLSAGRGQAVFFASQFDLLRDRWEPPPHALATAYFHGLPGTPDAPEFDECYRALERHHDEVERLQVTHSQMEQVVKSTGIDPAKVFRIPIGVDTLLFRPTRTDEREAVRAELSLPRSAFVVGSFVKDGVGVSAGDEPKRIKGPDVLLEALQLVRAEVPNLHVLLTGPARGFVRSGLDRLGIPYRHVNPRRYEKLPRYYRAVDVSLVASRQEGGPKAVLESMASGVPLVTTRVGQAMDLVQDGVNGWMAQVEDAEGLAERIVLVARGGADLDTVLSAARATASANAYDAQVDAWAAFFDGFVARG
jgi:glycosyltransferase involved in cell wall biosynthesis